MQSSLSVKSGPCMHADWVYCNRNMQCTANLHWGPWSFLGATLQQYSAWTFNETNIIMHIILLHGQCILCTDSNRSQWYQSKFATPGIDTFHNFRQQFHCQTLIEGVWSTFIHAFKTLAQTRVPSATLVLWSSQYSNSLSKGEWDRRQADWTSNQE